MFFFVITILVGSSNCKTCDAVKEGFWLKGLLDEICFVNKEVKVYIDNQSAIYLSKNPIYYDRNKHVDIKFCFVRNMVAKGLINLLKIPTKVNPFYIGTKILPSNKFRNYLENFEYHLKVMYLACSVCWFI